MSEEDSFSVDVVLSREGVCVFDCFELRIDLYAAARDSGSTLGFQDNFPNFDVKASEVLFDFFDTHNK